MIQFYLETDRALFEKALLFAKKQVRALVERYPDFYPMYTQKGKWKHEGPAWSRWCDGFLPGMMWVFHRITEKATPEAEYWVDQAIRYTKPLEPRQFDRESHDLGFVFFSTYYRWYRQTRDPRLHEILIQAGKTLALRFKENGQYLRSFVADDSLFIDIMMNVGIIFYAARETGDRTLRDIALRHSLTTRRVLVRGDGSVAHEGIFNLETGEFLRQSTYQGYRSDSCWSRGLAWALYGFGVCYEYSGDPRFLQTAEHCADYFITHTPASGVPPWDFNAPNELRSQVDTSAGAIAASALLRLCRLLPDPIKGHFYWNTAIRILHSLCDEHLGDGNPEWEGVLKGGVFLMQKKLAVDESVMWGDYFLVEALADAIKQLPHQQVANTNG